MALNSTMNIKRLNDIRKEIIIKAIELQGNVTNDENALNILDIISGILADL